MRTKTYASMSSKLTGMLMIILIGAGCGKSSKITLINNGKSDYTICVTDTSVQQIKRSASLLQSYLKKIGGASIPIKIGLTHIPAKAIVIKTDESFNRDGFSLITANKQLMITGGVNKGCIYGVIDLLERQLGCRMYAPGFEKIPQKTKISLPAMDIKDQPVNEYRNVYGRLTDDEEYRDWQRLDIVQDIFAEGYYVHTMSRLVPPTSYFKQHPEYFAWMNGRRNADQPCLSNPEVLKITLNRLETDMASQPNKKVWSVSQNDNFTYCQCDACKKIIAEEGSPAGPVIRFVNEVAKHFPDKTISTLAYQYSRQAPKVTKPADNVQIMLCTIELNRSQPIAEDPRSVSFLKDLEDWGKITKNIYLWDYTVNFCHHVSPFPNIHVLQPNIRFFVKNNVFSHFQQSNTDVGHEFSELKSYLIARLLWNPETNADSVITDFMNGYYGAAAPFIRTYLDTLEGEILKTHERLDIFEHPIAHENTFLSEQNLNRYFAWFDQALAVVKDQPEYLLHVRTARLPLQYATMEIGKKHMLADRGWFVTDGKKFILRERMVNLLEDFHQTCIDAGVRTLHEVGPSPEEYYQSTKQLLQSTMDDNQASPKTAAAHVFPSPE